MCKLPMVINLQEFGFGVGGVGYQGGGLGLLFIPQMFSARRLWRFVWIGTDVYTMASHELS